MKRLDQTKPIIYVAHHELIKGRGGRGSLLAGEVDINYFLYIGILCACEHKQRIPAFISTWSRVSFSHELSSGISWSNRKKRTVFLAMRVCSYNWQVDTSGVNFFASHDLDSCCMPHPPTCTHAFICVVQQASNVQSLKKKRIDNYNYTSKNITGSEGIRNY